MKIICQSNYIIQHVGMGIPDSYPLATGICEFSLWPGKTTNRILLEKPHPYPRLIGEGIMSISGRDIDGCVKVCKELDSYLGWPYLEINVCCAHSNNVHGFITRNEDHISRVVSSIKDAGVQAPIVIKMGHSDFIVPLANKAKASGADAIVA